MSKRFTEGIAFDGAAILDNGKPITITEILDGLNKLDELEQLKLCSRANSYVLIAKKHLQIKV